MRANPKLAAFRIIESDTEAFNGLVNAIASVIKDPMELPEKDITTVDAILFVQQTLKESSDLYNKGEYEASWRNYIRRSNEFLTKYSKFISSSQSNKIRGVIFDDQPVAQLAAEAWKSRNAFRDLLRELEQREDRIVDSYPMQLPERVPILTMNHAKQSDLFSLMYSASFVLFVFSYSCICVISSSFRTSIPSVSALGIVDDPRGCNPTTRMDCSPSRCKR